VVLLYREVGVGTSETRARGHSVASIKLHPNVANFFIEMDWADSRGAVAEFSERMVRHYEAGDVILLKNAPFSIDYDLLNQVALPKGRRFQKLSDKFISYPKVYRSEVATFMLENFASRPLFYLKFRHEVRRVSHQVRDFLSTAFSRYRLSKKGVSWRFTETGPESLHLDFFKPKADVDYLRLFINIDHQPRIWTMTHQVEELIERNYEKAGLAELQNAPSHQICQRLTDTVLKPLSLLPPDETDRHVVSFDQGDVWVCESRINSHQIFAGRRMIATDFYIDPTSLLDPSLRAPARIARCMQRCAQRTVAA
jgi:3-deoxy-D-manno-oct-2-ulosonic acid (Kdo) hydroxylase